MTRRTINAGLLDKPHTKRHQFAEPTALRRTECTSRACGVNASLWVRPSTRGATAPQGAQLVNLVLRRCQAWAGAKDGHPPKKVFGCPYNKTIFPSSYALVSKLLLDFVPIGNIRGE